ncbi:uncharacterized protein LOC116601640 [Nematostella vectensis]|uniref:uncharacterized protein LOC116601640 n=1 Tax=Nematostella vectensis TaxID=45351 RepID=UPI002076E8AF|nr:uncharacterized protein LOC116601640 [Nematostella vectensis]
MVGFCSATVFASIVLLAYQITVCQGSGKLSIRLVSYRNPNSYLYDGSCCDNANWCIDSCDNYFILCLAPPDSSDKCTEYKRITQVWGSDSISFGGSLGAGISNPFVFSFSRWKGVKLSVEVWDDDGKNIIGGNNDFVDQYQLMLSGPVSPSQASARRQQHRMTGRQSHLNIEAKLYCDANYLVPDCSEHCVSRDDDQGHYICDYVNGRRLCREGWHGRACLVWCIPRNDTSGRYMCDDEGAKICLEGWTGVNCTEGMPTVVMGSFSSMPTPSITQQQSTQIHAKWTTRETPATAPYERTTAARIKPACAMNSGYVTSSYSMTSSSLSPSISSSTSSLHQLSPSASLMNKISPSQHLDSFVGGGSETSATSVIVSTVNVEHFKSSAIVKATASSSTKICQSSSIVLRLPGWQSIVIEMEPREVESFDVPVEAVRRLFTRKLREYCGSDAMACRIGCWETAPMLEGEIVIDRRTSADQALVPIQVTARNLQAFIPSNVLLAIAESTKDELEDMTSANILKIWPLTDDPNITGDTGKRKADITSDRGSLLTFVLTGVGIVLLLVVVCFVVYRVKWRRSKNLTVNPLEEEEAESTVNTPSTVTSDKASLIGIPSKTNKDARQVSITNIELSEVLLDKPIKTPNITAIS